MNRYVTNLDLEAVEARLTEKIDAIGRGRREMMTLMVTFSGTVIASVMFLAPHLSIH